MDLFFGEFNRYFQIFLVLMACDYISGVLAALYKKEFHSNIGYKGIIKKVGMLICITVAKQIDFLNIYDEKIIVRSIVLLFFSINEMLSIIENLNKIGISLPSIITNSVKKIKNKNR